MTVPIVLLVYNRPKHLTKSLNSLKKIKKIKKIYFFCDGPKQDVSKKNIENIEKCRNIIKNVDWVNKKIYFQKKNIGLKNTLLLSAGIIFDKFKHEFVVYLEDDNIVLPGFYEYMRMCSRKFSANKNIFSVTGYNFLLNKKLYKEINEDYFFSNYTNTWAIGFWKRSWKIWKKEILNLQGSPKRNIFKKVLKSKNYILYDALLEGYLKTSNAGNTYFYTSWKYNKLNVYPKYPLIQNIGMDGSGENCIPTKKYENEKKFSSNYKFKIFKKKFETNKNIEKYLLAKNKITKKKIFFFKICPFIFQISILKIYFKVSKLLKKH